MSFFMEESERKVTGVIKSLVLAMRPQQWPKNLMLFMALVFSHKFFDSPLLGRTTLAFFLFCGIAGSAYLINDLFDLNQDKNHPIKKNRPLASGRLSVRFAILFSTALAALSLGLAFFLYLKFGLIVLGYFLLILTYSAGLKHVVILDVLVVSAGFGLRVLAGALLIDVSISRWLLICAMFLALFLVLCKRRSELNLLQTDSPSHRKILAEYNPKFLDQMVSIATALSIMSYTFYTTSPNDSSNSNLIITLPFMVYGIFRYLYLVYKKQMGGNPELIFIKDRPTMVNLGLFACSVIAILNWEKIGW